MRVAITGSHGLIGKALIAALKARGDEVLRVVRSFVGVPPQERVVMWHPVPGDIEREKLEGIDAAVHLAGENLAGVWTPGKKRRIRESRVVGTSLLARTLAELERKPSVLVSASGVGIYGDRSGGRPLDESAARGEGFLAEVGELWEKSADPARAAGIRVVHTRFGNVLSPDGGMLQVFLPFWKLGLGVKFGEGDQIWPWIALEDVVRAILFCIDNEQISGPVNVVAPHAVSNEEFTETIARAVHRPSFLKVPDFALKLAPGGMGTEMLLSGAHVLPRKLEAAGFRFEHPELGAALKSMEL